MSIMGHQFEHALSASDQTAGAGTDQIDRPASTPRVASSSCDSGGRPKTASNVEPLSSIKNLLIEPSYWYTARCHTVGSGNGIITKIMPQCRIRRRAQSDAAHLHRQQHFVRSLHRIVVRCSG